MATVDTGLPSRVLSGLRMDATSKQKLTEARRPSLLAWSVMSPCNGKSRALRSSITYVTFSIVGVVDCLTTVMLQFTERTPGSFIEERGASIRWRYWPGNPDDSELPWARRQAAEAQNHIWDSLGEKFGEIHFRYGSALRAQLPTPVYRLANCSRYTELPCSSAKCKSPEGSRADFGARGATQVGERGAPLRPESLSAHPG